MSASGASAYQRTAPIAGRMARQTDSAPCALALRAPNVNYRENASPRLYFPSVQRLRKMCEFAGAATCDRSTSCRARPSLWTLLTYADQAARSSTYTSGTCKTSCWRSKGEGLNSVSAALGSVEWRSPSCATITGMKRALQTEGAMAHRESCSQRQKVNGTRRCCKGSLLTA
jgi:hypothetical protein